MDWNVFNCEVSWVEGFVTSETGTCYGGGVIVDNGGAFEGTDFVFEKKRRGDV